MTMMNVAGVGRLCDNPETDALKTSVSTVTRCRMAFGKDDDDRGTATIFADVSIFGARGKAFADYHGKGDRVFVAGRLELRPWTTREGEERSTLQITVSDWTFAGDSAKDGDRDGQGSRHGDRRGQRGR